MKKTVLLLSLVAGLAYTLTCTTSCKKTEAVAVVKPTIYDSLGGTTMVADSRTSGAMIEKGRLGIRTVVDSTIFVIAGDDKLKGFFPMLLAEVGAGNFTGFYALEKSLTDFFCVALGAKNFTYSGKSMKAAHDPAQHPRMNGKAANVDFDNFITDLVKGAQQVGVPINLIQSIGKVVETTRADVVQK